MSGDGGTEENKTLGFISPRGDGGFVGRYYRMRDLLNFRIQLLDLNPLSLAHAELGLFDQKVVHDAIVAREDEINEMRQRLGLPGPERR